ncbi:DUF6069 family protein [Thermomicrobium sp. CFH 73360]|uniref:DUF6069 family protein n=1 Tax=Thermomicrobium sp. CFH 73360 TaxID=2951987 RepID=UPI002077015E|nr:DUF6069 family protein [Thermomicrobium sp. CFH 73360]MCM8746424.1 DUF6069 family protein [Thermomicrobium sp. CFH 73360]
MVFWRYGVLATAVAAILNAALWGLARAVGVSLVVQPPGQPETTIGLPQVLLLTVVPLLFGTAFYTVLRRWTRRPFLIFLILALLIFAVLLVPPFAATERAGTRFVLILMHVVATAALLAGLYRAELQRARP